jgi:uncharacterized protein YecT (DUF1311 family)
MRQRSRIRMARVRQIMPPCLTGSPEELAALNKTDAAWRDYRENLCMLPLKRISGSIAGPMSAECRLNLDRAYMKELSSNYILSQFPK